MPPVLSVQERAKIAAHYKVWGLLILVQRWWKLEHRVNATMNEQTIKNCHKRLTTTGCHRKKKRSEQPSTSQTPENIATVNEKFT
jgi:hypothetical protein